MSEAAAANQARPATPPMTKHHGAKIPHGREFRPEPLWSDEDERRQDHIGQNGNDGYTETE